METQLAEPPFPSAGLDALPPADIARKAAAVGEAKVGMPALSVFVLAVLAGAFIALGAVFATTVMAGGSELPFGVTRLLGGLAFSLGLILVVVAGAELFTGNNLIVMAWASRRVSTRRLLGNWALVYAGNFVGAVGTALIVYLGRQYELGGGEVGATAVRDRRGEDEPRLRSGRRARRALQRARVPRRLAHLQRTHRDGQDPRGRAADRRLRRRRVRAQRREHVLHPDRPARARTTLTLQGIEVEHLSWSAFFVDNLLPVTIGNVIGGAVMVGAVYWLVYLRDTPARS